MPRVRALLFVAAAALLSHSAFAQISSKNGSREVRGIDPSMEYAKRVDAARNVEALEEGAFGDRVSPYSGTTEFIVTDIDVPGNSQLPVRVSRVLDIALQPQTTSAYDALLGGMGNWDVDVPHLAATFPGSSEWSNQRCSQGSRPNLVVFGFETFDFWQGIDIHVPGETDRKMLGISSGVPTPSTPGITYRQTSSQRDMFSCIPMKSGLQGEGFRMRTADGMTYDFDVGVTRTAATMERTVVTERDPPSETLVKVERRRHYLLASKIADRFGNQVDIVYSPRGHPTSINANDGRQISLFYTANRLTSATSGGRTWNYSYHANGDLHRVLQPDNSTAWTYLYTGSLKPGGLSTSNPKPSFQCQGEPKILIASFGLTATHPSGMQGQFSWANRRHYRSGVHASECRRTLDGQGNVAFALTTPFHFDVMSLDSRTLGGPGLSTPNVWLYEYEVGTEFLWGNVDQPPIYPCTSCTQEKQTTLTRPDNSKVVYTYGKVYSLNDGRLHREQVLAADGSEMRSDASQYLSEAAASTQPFFGLYGSISHGDDPVTARVRPVVKTTITITQSQADFVFEVDAFNSWAMPQQVRRYSNLGGGGSRTEQLTWISFTQPWVLSQLQQVTSSGQIPELTTYDALTALPVARFEFGRKVWQRTYHSAGMQAGLIHTVADGKNQTTTLNDWRRGVPQYISFADQSTRRATVSDFGSVLTVVDELNNTTRFGYDLLDRLTSVQYPNEPNQTWAQTNITYSRAAFAEFGIGSTHWIRNESTGGYRKQTRYDAFWRPLSEHEYDVANTAATQRFRNWRYDYAGRVIFAAYPLANASSITSFPYGTSSTYDALGRPLTMTQDAEAGQRFTAQYAYLSGFQTRVTNPRGFATTTSFQAFDSPDTAAPARMDLPEGVTTTISRDVFGKPLSVTRSGTYNSLPLSASRRYVYDSHQRLCKRIEPEAGVTVFDYDGNNNVVWSADGQNLTSNVCDRSSVASSERTYNAYDLRDRLTEVNYPGTTVDSYYEYYADGALKRAYTDLWNPSDATSASDWTYTYNRRRLLTSESLAMFTGDAFAKLKRYEHGYSSLGHMARTTFPDNSSVNYAPNALGQPTMAGSYANGAQYFPDGALKRFTYGNGITRTNTQHPVRPLLKRSRDTFGDTFGTQVFHDFEYALDSVGNVQSITDIGGYGTQTRSMTYDGLDRLKSVNAPSQFGFARYVYDPLDNLREADEGSRQHRYTYQNERLSAINTPAGSAIWTFEFDARGNQTRRTSSGAISVDYAFDRANRLSSVTNQISGYYYDAHGRRAGEIRPNFAQYSLYTVDGMLRGSSDSDGANTNHIHLGKTLVASRRVEYTGATDITYHHTDLLGSPVLETTATRAQKNPTYYAPWGEPKNRSVEGPGYTGHLMDAPTGLIYMQQRYYDPAVGRFLSVDPVTTNPNTGAMFNRYNYAYNNPYKFTDPDGRLPILIPIAIFVAKELASEAVEQATGIPMPTVKNAGKAVLKQAAMAADAAKGKYKPGADFSRKTKGETAANADSKCEYCKVDTVQAKKSERGVTPPRNEGVTDHSTPKSKGGDNSPGNAVHACRDCNEKFSDSPKPHPRDDLKR